AHIVTIALSVFFHGSPDHRDLPSFPTRRSSDLNEGIERRIGQSCERARIAEPLPETLERRVQELPPAVGRDAGLDALASRAPERSEEHTSELQSQSNLVCRLLLEKKKKKTLPQL